MCAYLAARFPLQQFPHPLSRELCALTSGNPLFLSRVVDVLLERGLIQRRGEHWELRGALSSLTEVVPDRLVLLIAGETDRLTAFERSVLEAASVAGFEFSVAAVAAALEHEVVELEELCSRWIREGRFFKPAGGVPRDSAPLRCEFCHTLYRQALYQRLTPTRRMQLHLRLGLHEERSQPGQLPSSAGLLAMHFKRGGDPERATRYGLEAGPKWSVLLASAAALIACDSISEDGTWVATPVDEAREQPGPSPESSASEATELGASRSSSCSAVRASSEMRAQWFPHGRGGSGHTQRCPRCWRAG